MNNAICTYLLCSIWVDKDFDTRSMVEVKWEYEGTRIRLCCSFYSHFVLQLQVKEFD